MGVLCVEACVLLEPAIDLKQTKKQSPQAVLFENAALFTESLAPSLVVFLYLCRAYWCFKPIQFNFICKASIAVQIIPRHFSETQSLTPECIYN